LLFFFSVKDSPPGLSADALPRAANSFAESGRTAEDTAVPCTGALQKSGFPQVFVKSLSLCVFVFQLK
jgi:hypothetical protein